MSQYGLDPKDILSTRLPWDKPQKKTVKRSALGNNKVLFERLYKKFKGVCQLCKKRKQREDITTDHIKPISKGGTHNYSNLQILCFRCNSAKGNGTMAQARIKIGFQSKRKKRKAGRRKTPKTQGIDAYEKRVQEIIWGR